jgi:hypothetical protein
MSIENRVLPGGWRVMLERKFHHLGVPVTETVVATGDLTRKLMWVRGTIDDLTVSDPRGRWANPIAHADYVVSSGRSEEAAASANRSSVRTAFERYWNLHGVGEQRGVPQEPLFIV